MKVGVNFLSDGNRGADYTLANLQHDFALFVENKITQVDVRLVWTSIEPSQGSYSSEVLANTQRFITTAKSYGLTVGLSFWTQPPYESRNFALPSWVNSWTDLWNNTASRTAWLNMVEHVVANLNPKPDYWMAANEPYSTSTVRAAQTEFLNLTLDRLPAQRSVRFIAGWNPFTNYFPISLADKLSFLAMTIYNDPNNDAYETTSRTDWAGFKNSIDQAMAVGLKTWVIEFGKNTDDETQRLHFQDSLSKRFVPYGVELASAWAWVHSGSSIENWTINRSGGTPRPAFYELPKVVDGSGVAITLPYHDNLTSLANWTPVDGAWSVV